MTRMTITRGSNTVSAKFLTEKNGLAQVDAVYPLKNSVTGIVVGTDKCPQHKDGSHYPPKECTCKFYCNTHVTQGTAHPGQLDESVQVLTIATGKKMLASCSVCNVAMFINWTDNNELDYLRDKLIVDGDYSAVEIYAEWIVPRGSYDCIQYGRLVPGARKMQALSPDFDFLDASKDRYYYWPQALHVPLATIKQEIQRREKLFSEQAQPCACITGRGACGSTDVIIECSRCNRPACSEHTEEQEHPLHPGQVNHVCAHCKAFADNPGAYPG